MTGFSEAATSLWQLQNEAVAARAVATMGGRVDLKRHVTRYEQAERAQATYVAAVDAATPETIAEYAALLHWRHENGMKA